MTQRLDDCLLYIEWGKQRKKAWIQQHGKNSDRNIMKSLEHRDFFRYSYIERMFCLQRSAKYFLKKMKKDSVLLMGQRL